VSEEAQGGQERFSPSMRRRSLRFCKRAWVVRERINRGWYPEPVLVGLGEKPVAVHNLRAATATLAQARQEMTRKPMRSRI
jgi:hypothetical protein